MSGTLTAFIIKTLLGTSNRLPVFVHFGEVQLQKEGVDFAIGVTLNLRNLEKIGN